MGVEKGKKKRVSVSGELASGGFWGRAKSKTKGGGKEKL